MRALSPCSNNTSFSFSSHENLVTCDIRGTHTTHTHNWLYRRFFPSDSRHFRHFRWPAFPLINFSTGFQLVVYFSSFHCKWKEKSEEAATIRLDGLKLIKIWNNFFRMRHSLIHTKMNFRLRFFHLIARCPFPVPLMEAFQWLFCVSVLSVYWEFLLCFAQMIRA